MRKIGLTGGIGSGKSVVAKRLSDAGIPVIDMDQVSREVTQLPEVLEEIRALFGDELFQGKQLDREALRKIVFHDSNKRRALEDLLHPRIRQEFENRAEKEADSGHTLVICEAPLLIEGGYADTLDALVVVMADSAIRKERVMARDQIAADLFERISHSQTDDATRKSRADFLLTNNSTLEAIHTQVDQLVNDWKQKRWLPAR